jgi:hypothetical protein
MIQTNRTNNIQRLCQRKCRLGPLFDKERQELWGSNLISCKKRAAFPNLDKSDSFFHGRCGLTSFLPLPACLFSLACSTHEMCDTLCYHLQGSRASSREDGVTQEPHLFAIWTIWFCPAETPSNLAHPHWVNTCP